MLSPPSPASATVLFLAAILGGSALGAAWPGAGEAAGGWVDPLVLTLVAALFFTLRFDGLPALRRAPRVVLVAIGMNFLAIPTLALALTALLPGDALRLGVLIYCLAPCTDWFLGFTRLAGGDTATGAALIPLQMILQLALYPLWLGAFAGEQVGGVLAEAGPTLLTWFALPAGVGLTARGLVHLAERALRPRVGAGWAPRVVDGADRAIPPIIAAVIACIFAGNVGTIIADLASFAWVLLVVFLFFVATFALGEVATRVFRLPHPQRVLLTMTTSARNAPLMLAVTTIALPDQPIVHAAIVLGMLIEFPHLTALTHILRRGASAPRIAAPAGAA